MARLTPPVEDSSSKEVQIPQEDAQSQQVSERELPEFGEPLMSSEQGAAADGVAWPSVLAVLAGVAVLGGVGAWALVLRRRQSTQT